MSNKIFMIKPPENSMEALSCLKKTLSQLPQPLKGRGSFLDDRNIGLATVGLIDISRAWIACSVQVFETDILSGIEISIMFEPTSLAFKPGLTLAVSSDYMPAFAAPLAGVPGVNMHDHDPLGQRLVRQELLQWVSLPEILMKKLTCQSPSAPFIHNCKITQRLVY
jgi:hypothetical protein